MTRERGSWPSVIAGALVLSLLAGCVPSAIARQHQPTAATNPVPAVASPRPTPTVARSPVPNVAQLVGQRLVVAMDGTTAPSTALLGRIRRGEVGGVILFGRNVTTATALRSLTTQLQAAAAAGGQPRLLVAVDQEGGSIKRIPWAPPTLSPPQMGADGRTSTARSQGEATGAALRGLGINVDLAPVADVPASTSSFLYKQGRTFSFNADTTAALATAFAGGLSSEHVAPAMKHFPGLGMATLNTDTSVMVLHASKAALAPGLKPYQAAIPTGLPIVMLSNATYNAYDADNAAGWSGAIVNALLRTQLGFDGVTVTDSLDGTAHARGVSTASLALLAIRAGTDLILLTGSEAASSVVFTRLYDAALAGSPPRASLRTSYDRIQQLKVGL